MGSSLSPRRAARNLGLSGGGRRLRLLDFRPFGRIIGAGDLAEALFLADVEHHRIAPVGAWGGKPLAGTIQPHIAGLALAGVDRRIGEMRSVGLADEGYPRAPREQHCHRPEPNATPHRHYLAFPCSLPLPRSEG